MNIDTVDLLPILRSVEQAQILTELFVIADGGRSLADLARATGVSPGGVHKEVERLEQAGLVVSERVGRTRLVTANPSSPLVPDLRSMLAKAYGPEPLLRKGLSRLAGIEEAFIYGSWARVSTEPMSGPPQDVDLMVVGAVDVDEVYEVLREVEEQIGRPVNPTILTAAEWVEDRSGFARHVRDQPQIRLIGGLDD